MNLEKFTDRAKGFLQAAQTLAIRLNHQRITPEHVLKALLEDSEGMASGLIQRSGGNPAMAQQGVDAAFTDRRRLRRMVAPVPKDGKDSAPPMLIILYFRKYETRGYFDIFGILSFLGALSASAFNPGTTWPATRPGPPCGAPPSASAPLPAGGAR